MNPPFVSPLLTPSLSSISAEFSYPPNGRSSNSTSERSASTALGAFSISTQPALPPNPSALEGERSRALQWSRLLSFRRKDDSVQANLSLTPQRSESQITPSSNSTAQSSLLSAQSVESLPQFALPERENLEGSQPAPSRPQTGPTIHGRDPASTTSPQPGPSIAAKSVPTPRRKLSLSSPHDKPNSAPLMHRRPATGNNGAGIYHGPVSCEQSGFANFGVAAAEERWRKGDMDGPETVWSQMGIDELAYDLPLEQNDSTSPSVPHKGVLLSEGVNSASITDGTSNSSPTTRHKPSLSSPRNTQNSSPLLHVSNRSRQNSTGVYAEWICRERSGFANPTNATFQYRWGVADEREGQGRWNGLPSVNSWDMSKSHVMSSSNCFDPILSGFGMSRRVTGQNGEGGEDASLVALLSDVKPASSTRKPPCGEGDRDDSGDREVYRTAGDRNSGSLPPDQAEETRLLPRPGDGIGHYPVPAGLIAASREAQRTRTLDHSDHANMTPVETEAGGPSQDPDQRRISRGNALGLHATARPRSSGFGERDGLSARDRRERKEYAARSLEQERHIKGTHLPLRVTKGNANGLRFSQARNCGFGERNGVIPRDKHEQSKSLGDYNEADSH